MTDCTFPDLEYKGASAKTLPSLSSYLSETAVQDSPSIRGHSNELPEMLGL